MTKTSLIALFLAATFGHANGQWVRTNGPTGASVSVLCSSGNSLLASVPGAGVFATRDAGASWEGPGSGLTSSYITSFAGTGTVLYAGGSGGVFSSLDNGKTWNTTGLSAGLIRALGASGPNIVAYVDMLGIMNSTDGGATWNLSSYKRPNAFVSSGQYMFAAMYNGVLRSSDNGISWNYVDSGFTNAGVNALAASGVMVIAGTDSGVFVSTDAGLSWKATNSGLTNRSVFALGANGSTLLTLTGGGPFRSTDNGNTWGPANAGLGGSTVHSFAFIGSTAFAGASTGVFASTNNGASWTPINTGPPDILVSCVALAGTAIFASSFGLNEAFSTTNQGTSWANITPGLPNASLRQIVLTGGMLIAATDSGTFRSTDSGLTWKNSSTGLPNTPVWALLAAGANVFAGTSAGVFLSTNNGASWSGTGTLPGSSTISSLASNGTVLLAGSFTGPDGTYLSTNNGTTWTLISSGLPASNLNALAIYGTTFIAGTNSGAFASTNNGVTWTAANSGLPTTNVSAFAASQGALFAGTSNGVFVLTGIGAAWAAQNTSLTNLPVYALATDGTTMYAGTPQGMWRRPAMEMLPVFSPNPTGFAFNPMEVGRTVIDTLEVRNPGGLPLIITNAQGGGSYVSIAPSAGTVPPGDSMRFLVWIKPTFGSLSRYGTQMVFTDNAFDSPQMLNVSGWSFDTVFFASRYNLDFGGVSAGSNKVDSLWVTNYPVEPDNPLIISQVWPDDSLSYSVSPGLYTVLPFQKVTFRITFHPNKPGLTAAHVFFIHNYGGCDTINVRGFGLPLSPQLAVPPDRAVNQSRTPQLQWSSLAATDFYQVQVARDSLFTLLVADDSTITGLTKTVPQLDTSTVYFWHVRGKNAGGWGAFSPFSRFTTVPLAPPTPSGSTPADSASNLLRPVLLGWGAVPRAVQYRLRVSTFSDLSSPVLDTVLAGLNCSASQLDPDQLYFWGVVASNPGGDSPPSPVRRFKTAPGPPAPPQLYLPANNATDQQLSVSLVWHRTNKTDFYELQLSDTSSFSRLTADTSVADTFLTSRPLKNQQWYYWRVFANNTGGIGNPSQAFSFLTVPYPPSPPGLISPADKDSTQPSNVDLQWNVVNGSTGYHVQLSNDPTVPPPNPIVDDSTLLNSVTKHVSNLIPGHPYYWRVRAKNAGGWGAFTANRSFYVPTLPQAPTLQSPADKIDKQDPNNTSFGWNDVGAQQYDLRVSLRPSLLNPVFEDSLLQGHTRQVSGLAYNTTYYWSVRSISASRLASDFTKPPFSFSTAAAKSFVSTTVWTFPSTSPSSTDYRLVSFPGGSGWLVNQILPGGTQGVDWRVYRDNGGTPPNHLTELGSTATLNAGEGYWMVRLGLLEFTQNVTMPVLDSAGTFSIPLRTGWNLIGDPFASSIPWTSIQIANGSDSLQAPSTWNSKYEVVSSLDPFKGYYFYNKAGLTSLRLPFPFPGLPKIPPASRPIDWRIDLRYAVDGEDAGHAWLGTSPAAGYGYCALNEYHPPVMPDQPDLYFHRPTWDSLYSHFSSDFRARLNDGQVWDFEVCGKRMSASFLKLSGVGTVPAGTRVVLVNLQNTVPIDVVESQKYSFVLTSERMSFRLIVGKPAFVDQELLKLTPGQFTLEQNYPNPFNPSTTLMFDMPKTGNVQLEIVSLLGQRVALLADGILGAGRYSVVWDAHQSGSAGAASGIYFARLMINGMQIAVRKMVLLK